MTSEAKIAANRRNAQKSTGPRTDIGKALTRHNAFKHGLSVPISSHNTMDPKVAELARDLVTFADEDSLEIARAAAQAQFAVLRVRETKMSMIERYMDMVGRDDSASALTQDERACMVFATNARMLTSFDRYERRALSHRKRKFRELENRKQTVLTKMD